MRTGSASQGGETEKTLNTEVGARPGSGLSLCEMLDEGAAWVRAGRRAMRRIHGEVIVENSRIDFL